MKKKVIGYLHTHWDREWYRTYEEFSMRLVSVFDEILDELKCENAPCFYFDGQVDALKTYLNYRPQKLPLIKKLIKEKKLYTGPFLVSADSFLTGGWSLIKNLESGMDFAKKMGEKEFIGYLPDTFGHSRGIFNILKYFGITNAIAWRGIGDLPSDFYFNGIKLTRLVQGYFMDAIHTGNTELLEKTLDKISGYSPDLILLPIGADHLKILSDAKNRVNEINKKLKNYEIKLSSPFEYINNAKYKDKINGEFLDNSSTYILQGVYSARTYQKIKNSVLEWEISRIVEPLNLIEGNRFEAEIKRAYEFLIKNHAHDSLYGCSTDAVHRDVERRFEHTEEILDGVKERIILAKIKSSKGRKEKIACYNLSNYNFSGVIEVKSEKKLKNAQLISVNKGFTREKLYDTSQIPVTEDYRNIYNYLVQTHELKPFTYNVFDIGEIKSSLHIKENSIENDKIKLFIENNKIYLEDKIKGEIKSNFLQITDTDDEGDSYNFSPKDEGKTIPLLKSKIIEKGKLRSVLRLFYKDIKLDVILENNSDYIGFKAEINNKKKNHKLQVKFNFEEKVYKTISEDTTGFIRREYDPDYSLLNNIPADYPKEAKTNCYPMKRFVCFDGVGIITKGLSEYEIYKNSISVSLMRAIGVISNPKNPARRISAGPPLEIPEAQCPGKNYAEFGVCFEDEPEKLFEIAEKFYNPCVAFLVYDDNNRETRLLKSQKGKVLYGMKDKNTGVFYDLKKEELKDINIGV